MLDKAIDTEYKKITDLRSGLLKGFAVDFPESTKLAEVVEYGCTKEKDEITKWLHSSKLLLHGRSMEDYNFDNDDDVISEFKLHSTSTRVKPCKLVTARG